MNKKVSDLNELEKKENTKGKIAFGCFIIGICSIILTFIYETLAITFLPVTTAGMIVSIWNLKVTNKLGTILGLILCTVSLMVIFIRDFSFVNPYMLYMTIISILTAIVLIVFKALFRKKNIKTIEKKQSKAQKILKSIMIFFWTISIVCIALSIICLYIEKTEYNKACEMYAKSAIARSECEEYNDKIAQTISDYKKEKYIKIVNEKSSDIIKYDRAYRKHHENENDASQIKGISLVLFAINFSVGFCIKQLNKIRENEGRDAFYKAFLKLGIFIFCLGMICTILLIALDESIAMTVLLFSILIGGDFVCGYITYNILKGKEYSFLWGLLLGIIGILIAACLSNNNNTEYQKENTNDNASRYDDLAKLQKLRESGALTEDEFRKEKEKILKN